MFMPSKTIAAGLVFLVVLATGIVGDALLNGSRLLNVVSGRPSLIEACLPELRKSLTDRGFAPDDIQFQANPAIGANWAATRMFTSDFSFQDGPEATRIDGVMACVVSRTDVKVDVHTIATPVRAG